jgi:predicted DNA-binding transcriptional regulator AlpA
MTAPIVLLTFAETAERLRKSEDALRWMVHKGNAPKPAKIGGRLMFKESDVNDFVEAQFTQEASA